MTALKKPQAQYLKDYQAPPFLIDHIDLTFDLLPLNTRVTSIMTITKKIAGVADLVLDGIDLTLISITVDNNAYTDYDLLDEQLVIHNLPAQCQLTIVNEIAPKTNTSLEGLYLSGGAYCTQCEAQGFRKITYYLDRPDVLASFDVTIIADEQFTHLLSNGNKLAEGKLDNGRHFAKTHSKSQVTCSHLLQGTLMYLKIPLLRKVVVQ